MLLKTTYALIFAGMLSSNMVLAAECLGDQRAPSHLTFEVVPQFPATTLFATWGPFLDAIGKASQLCFELIIPKDIPEFEADFSQGQADFIYANPYHFLVARKKQKYNPLLAEGKDLLSGILVEKVSNPSRELGSLSGKTVAFPSPNSFGASLLTRSELTQKGISFTPKYVKTHSNVYRAVITGDATAGGGLRSTLEAEPKEIQDQLKVMYVTREFTPHPIAIKPSVSEKTRADFLQATLDCTASPACIKLLTAIKIEHPRKVTNADYKSVEMMRLEKFAQ